MRWFRVAIVGVASVGLVTVGQAADLNLSGQVKDAGRGDAIVGAKVTILKESGPQTWKELISTRTNDKGYYTLAGLPDGRTRVLFERITYKHEDVTVMLKAPPAKREINMDLILLNATAAYFQNVGMAKAARVNRVLEEAGPQQAAALYLWGWSSCVAGLSVPQTKPCADGLYGNVSAKVAKPKGIEAFTNIDVGALSAVDSMLKEGSDPGLSELQKYGVSPEVAWFVKWQQLQKAGTRGPEIEGTRKTLFEKWKIPVEKRAFFETQMPDYPALIPYQPDLKDTKG